MENQNKSGGIVFIRTANLDTLKDFYMDRVGCTLWLDQGGCAIFRHGNMLLGFCQADKPEIEGVYTFFYTHKNQVDVMYEKFRELADGPPRVNPKYLIYHFYATDPEGRSIEFQYFQNEIKDFWGCVHDRRVRFNANHS
jgi:hypothetical protein